MKPAAIDALHLSFQSLAARGCTEAALAYIQRFEQEQSDKLASDANGSTYLHMVAESGGCSAELIQGLVSMGLTPNAANRDGDTPLHVAARCGHVDICRALVAAGADPLVRNGKNRKPRDQLKVRGGGLG
jgi:ankyrin repeat protein